MSQELNRDSFYEYKGNKYHRDKYGSWFVKNSGYESLFISSIQDEGLKSEAINELQGATTEKVNFTYDDMDITLWVNVENPEQSKIDRAPKINTGEKTYDKTEDTSNKTTMPKINIDKSAFNKPKSGGGDYKKSKRFYDIEYTNWSDFLSKRAKNPFIDLYEKANPNVFLIKREGTDMEDIMCIIARTQYE